MMMLLLCVDSGAVKRHACDHPPCVVAAGWGLPRVLIVLAPPVLMQLIQLGYFVCLDSFLTLFTILPLRLLMLLHRLPAMLM